MSLKSGSRLGDRWGRWRRKVYVALIVFYMALAGAGLVRLLFGHGNQRAGGATGLLIFGTGAVTLLLWRSRPRAGLERVQLADVAIEGQAVRGFVLSFSSLWFIFMLGGGVALSAALLLLGLFPETSRSGSASDGFARIIGFGGAALFGTATLAAVWLTLRRRHAVALTPAGLVFPSRLRSRLIPWTAIDEVSSYTKFFMDLVGIRLMPDVTYDGEPVVRRIHRFNRRLSGWDLSLPASFLGIDPNILAGLLRRFVATPDARATIGTARGLAELGAEELRDS